jgi:hypothetical protein
MVRRGTAGTRRWSEVLEVGREIEPGRYLAAAHEGFCYWPRSRSLAVA